MRKSFLAAGAAVFALLATGCSAGGGGSSEQLTIAWISPDATSSARWETQDLPAFKAAVGKIAPGAEIIASTASTDEEMLQQAESAVTQGAEVIVVNPITADGGLPIADLGKRDNVPILAYEGLIADAELDGYITFDNREVGRLQAQYIADNVPDGGQIAIMNGAQVCAACIDFKTGAHEVLDPLVAEGALTIGYEADTPDWLSENAQSQTEQALTSLGDNVPAVLAANDGLAQGVIAALKSRQLNGDVIVTGQDATLAGLQEILLGNQTMTVYKDFGKQAAAAAQAAVDLARGEAASNLKEKFDNGGHSVPALFLDPAVIEKDGVAGLVEDGFVSRDELCTAEVEAACDF